MKDARNFWLKGSKILQILFRRILPVTLQFTEILAARVKLRGLLNGIKSPLKGRIFQTVEEINLLAPELFFLILAHPVYKMWIV